MMRLEKARVEALGGEVRSDLGIAATVRLISRVENFGFGERLREEILFACASLRNQRTNLTASKYLIML